MTEVIKRVMSQILGVEASDIVADSSPETIERWDSLKHMQLIMALVDELGIQFPDEVIPELINFATIETTTKELSAG
jgi:acyl carrier protein